MPTVNMGTLVIGVDYSNGTDHGAVAVCERYQDGLIRVLGVAMLPVSEHKPPRRVLMNRIAEIEQIAHRALNPEEL